MQRMHPSQISEEKNVTLIMIDLIIRKITISIMIKKNHFEEEQEQQDSSSEQIHPEQNKRHIPYTTQMMNNAIRILKIQ